MQATEDDIEAVATAIELVEAHSSEDYARAAIPALEERGWRPPENRRLEEAEVVSTGDLVGASIVGLFVFFVSIGLGVQIGGATGGIYGIFILGGAVLVALLWPVAPRT
jgi:hypothetical protein